MRLRTLALALALSCGMTGMVEAAASKPKVAHTKKTKFQIKKNKHYKYKAPKIKHFKAPKRG